MKEGDLLSFRYKARFVKGIVKVIHGNFCTIKLETDYIGKNDEWYKGENKDFSIKAMKRVAILTHEPNKNDKV